MKNTSLKGFLAVCSMLTLGFQASAKDWKLELSNYKNSIQNLSNFELHAKMSWYTAKTMASCSASATLLGSAVVSDTMPILNVVSESLANIVDDEYVSMEADTVFSFKFWGDLLRGAMGGGVLGLVETLELIPLYLAGDTEKSYEWIAKNYESSLTTLNKLFSEQSACLMSFSKLSLTGDVLSLRKDPAYYDKFFSENIAP